MFCPKCGSILIPKKEGEKVIKTCKCGYRSADAGDGKIKEKAKETASKLEVIEDKEAFETMPTTRAECPKCRNNEAVFWEVQTRAADEPATKFLKCKKCSHIWRDYS